MKISDALKDVRDIEVPFGPSVLRVTYRPPSWTVAEAEELQGSKDINLVVDQIRRLVVQWDLTDDYDRIVPLEKPVQQPESVTFGEEGERIRTEAAVWDDPLRHIPINIYMKIIQAIRKDQTVPGEA